MPGHRPLRTHCPRGHALSGDNVRIYPARPHDRHCRTCDMERKRERRAEERQRVHPVVIVPQPTHRRLADGGIGGRAEAKAIAAMLERQSTRASRRKVA